VLLLNISSLSQKKCLFQLIDSKQDLRHDNNIIGNGSSVGLVKKAIYIYK